MAQTHHMRLNPSQASPHHYIAQKRELSPRKETKADIVRAAGNCIPNEISRMDIYSVLVENQHISTQNKV
jgi:hypothetical protein